MAYKVSRSKTLLDKIRKEVIADAKSKIDKANGVWRPAKEKLEKWRNEVRQPVTDWEEEEKRKDDERKSKIQGQIASISALLSDLKGMGSVEQISIVISKLRGMEIKPEEYFEFTVEAQATLDKTIFEAEVALKNRKRLDKEEEESRIEKARLEDERKKQDEEAARLREEQAKIDAEKRKLEDEKAKMELEKAQKEQAEKLKAENERREKEKAEREAIEKERLEQLKPDKEKLTAFAQYLQEGVVYPDVKSEEAKVIISMVKDDLCDIGEKILDAIEEV